MKRLTSLILATLLLATPALHATKYFIESDGDVTVQTGNGSAVQPGKDSGSIELRAGQQAAAASQGSWGPIAVSALGVVTMVGVAVGAAVGASNGQGSFAH